MDGSTWMEGMREPWKEGSSSSYLPAQAACLHPTSSHIRLAVLPCSVRAALRLPGGEETSLFSKGTQESKSQVPKFTTASGENLWGNSSF